MAVRRSLSIEDKDLSKVTVATTSNRKYLDLDLAFAPRPVSGDIFKKSEAAAVRQAVKNILMTNYNEKPFQPFFGANLNNYLFELADGGALESDIEDEIRTALATYEPRVEQRFFDIRGQEDSLQIDVNLSPDANSLTVTVIFNVINSSERVEVTTTLNRLR